MQDISQEMFSITHYMYVFSHGMEEKDEWKKIEGGTEVMNVLSRSQNPGPLHPNHGSHRCKPLRIGDRIIAIPWVYEGL